MIALTAGMKFYQSNGAPLLWWDELLVWECRLSDSSPNSQSNSFYRRHIVGLHNKIYEHGLFEESGTKFDSNFLLSIAKGKKYKPMMSNSGLQVRNVPLLQIFFWAKNRNLTLAYNLALLSIHTRAKSWFCIQILSFALLDLYQSKEPESDS